MDFICFFIFKLFILFLIIFGICLIIYIFIVDIEKGFGILFFNDWCFCLNGIL